MSRNTSRAVHRWDLNKLLKRHAGLTIAAVLGALFCIVAIAFSQTAWAPTKAVSYGKITRDALDRLLSSANDLRNGNTAGAQQKLQGMEASAAELTKAADFFREQANRENNRCVSNIGKLEDEIAKIFEKEKEAERRIASLQAELKGITERKNYSAAQIEQVKRDVELALAAMKEREAKLEELRKWWWVPFYNLYLGIRTLVDDDIGNYNSLRNTLQDKATEMAKHQGDWQAASQMMSALTREHQEIQRTHAGLLKMRNEAEADLGNLKKSAIFLTDAGIFWGRVTNLLKIRVTRPVDLLSHMTALDMLMSKKNEAPLFHNLQAKPFNDLYDSLAAFADTIDQGNNFLMAEGSDYCGGPPRSNTTTVSSACKIEATKFYEIVNPVTCAFQYKNPPGCPPRPRVTQETEQAVAAGRARGSWVRADGTNWVGRARCEPESIYYGKVNDQDQCERKCLSDGTCVAWTYNRNNGMISGTTGECWGGTRALTPNKTSWGGFQSGGIQ